MKLPQNFYGCATACNCLVASSSKTPLGSFKCLKLLDAALVLIYKSKSNASANLINVNLPISPARVLSYVNMLDIH
jgi:hypothetical protein